MLVLSRKKGESIIINPPSLQRSFGGRAAGMSLIYERRRWSNSPMLASEKRVQSLLWRFIPVIDDITIVVVEIRGDKVRLGIECPKEVPVHRLEVYEAIRRNQQKTPTVEPDSTPPSTDNS